MPIVIPLSNPTDWEPGLMWAWGKFSLRTTNRGIKIDPETMSRNELRDQTNFSLKGLGRGINQVDIKEADSEKKGKKRQNRKV